MEKIEVYKTIDGTIFENESDAITYENKKIMEIALTELCENHCYRGMDSNDIVDMILENKNEILKILTKNK